MAKEIYSQEITFCGRRVRLVLIEYVLGNELRRRIQVKNIDTSQPKYVIPDKKRAEIGGEK